MAQELRLYRGHGFLGGRGVAHEAVKDRVWLINCADEVLEELELVALMHGLFMPGARRDRFGGQAGR